MAELLKALESLHIPNGAVAIFAIVIYFWPHLRRAWIEWSERTGQWAHYRNQLELLKLRCDIQVLKRANNLNDADFPFPAVPMVRPTEELPTSHQPTSYWRRFQYGALGAATTIAVGLISVYLSDIGMTGGFVGWVAILTAIAAIGGLVSLPLRLSSRWHSFAVGASFPVVLVSLVIVIQN